jgi:predicted dehydrogenase
VAELVFVGAADRWVAIDGAADLLDDLGSHQFDLLRLLFSAEIETVSATRVTPHEIRMAVTLADETVARCRLAYAGIPDESVRVVVGARRYRIHAKSNRVTPADGPGHYGLDVLAWIWWRATGIRPPLLRSFDRELRALVAAVRDGVTPRPSGADGVAAARAVAAARESLALGGAAVRPS